MELPTKERIKTWLKDTGKSREWLGRQCGSPENPIAKRTVDNWLSSPQEIPQSTLVLIGKLIAEDEKEAAAAKLDELDRFTVECLPEEFDAWNAAAMAQGQIVREWARQALIRAAEAEEDSAPNITPITSGSSQPKAHILAAAGSPIGAEVTDWDGADDTIMVRINGLSMVPTLNDGDVVAMKLKRAARNPFMKKGLAYLVDYDGGYTVKRYDTRRATPEEAGEEWVQDGKVKVLKSDNPDFGEIIIKGPIDWIAWLP